MSKLPRLEEMRNPKCEVGSETAILKTLAVTTSLEFDLLCQPRRESDIDVMGDWPFEKPAWLWAGG
jgi:hypothetical protein